MIRMILADDEPVITRGIQKLVDWPGLGIEIVGEYTDGRSVLEGIIRLKPELALLDISMPGMTGVEILKECSLLNIPTQIIFVSGFQDFAYAKAAIKYGAVDYLLKPVIREELLRAVEKCLNKLMVKEYRGKNEQIKETEEKEADYSNLNVMEECDYLPVYVEIFYQPNENCQTRKLIRFSILSFLENYLEENQMGIIFTKEEHIVVVFKGLNQIEGRLAAEELRLAVTSALRHSVGMVIGRQVTTMGEIPEEFDLCLDMRGYFFFAGQMESPVLLVDKPVFTLPVKDERLFNARENMIEAVVGQDHEGFKLYYDQYVKLVCRASDGKKEDACFYFCTAVRMLEEKFNQLSLPGKNMEMKILLQKGRNCESYEELLKVYEGIFQEYLQSLQETIVSNDKQDFVKAKVYIENHYHENLTLSVLANEVHMNPYYFSSFFKKNAGENFKDYVNKIRIQHAVSLLVSTDMKAYEIAVKVGFGDARVFSENFQRIYHETPKAYRNKARE